MRLSDFKSNEYRKLIGGSRYEPEEENPMLGFRGASALHQRRVRRSLRHGMRGAQARAQRHGPDQRRGHGALRAHRGQAERVTQLLAEQTAEARRGRPALIMMCEVPSNAILAESSCSSSTASPSAPTT
ncbi:MAG: hypothetical protein LKM38_13795 [Pseudomonas veronii]|nr:hypothetical protein [Pseudomonas veronii]